MKGDTEPGFNLIKMRVVGAVQLLNESVVFKFTGQSCCFICQCAFTFSNDGLGPDGVSTAMADRLFETTAVISAITIIP